MKRTVYHREGHYSRNRFNRPPLTQALAEQLNWQRQDSKRSIYHQHGLIPGYSNTKYLSPDGRQEAVYDPYGNLVTDAANLGTYNYGPGHEDFPHFFNDVIPY